MAELEEIIRKFKDLAGRVEDTLTKGTVTGEFKYLMKLIYDLCQTEGFRGQNALPELIVDNLDNEQLWQEIELQNESFLPRVIDQVSKILVNRNLTKIPVLMSDQGALSKKINLKKTKPLVEREMAVSSEESSAYEEDSNDEMDDVPVAIHPSGKPPRAIRSEVDDRFFKMQEMEEFLSRVDSVEADSNLSLFDDADSEAEDNMYYSDFFAAAEEESEESNGQRPELSEESSDEDGILQEDLPSQGAGDISFIASDQEDGSGSDNDDDQESDEEHNLLAGEINGSDQGDDSGSDGEQNLLMDKKVDKRVRFTGLNCQEEESDEEIEEPSSFKKRQQRLRSTIDQLEDDALAEKPWALKGEVAAGGRPVNSLLEELVEFDTVQRPSPVITEATTDKLEDIICKRVRDRAFDDVERKIKPVAAPAEFKKKLVLDQEKSKQSLAEIYETEYLKQKQEASTEEKMEIEPEEHVEIKKRMAILMRKLDALSDMYFIPRHHEPELKIVSNTPAATAEEVGPTISSEAALLAPEEVASTFTRNLQGKEERTKTDKKRERRKKKRHQARKFKAQASAAAGHSETTYAEELRKAKKFKNVTTLEERIGGTTKSSRDFFGKLQEVQSTSEQKKRKQTKQSNNSFNAKKLKL